MDSISKTFKKLDTHLRKASIGKIDVTHEPISPTGSWFGGHGVSRSDEKLPIYKNSPMFPLLQVNCSELPYVHPELVGIALFVVYMNRFEIPFDKLHGDGWLVREYSSLTCLEVIKDSGKPDFLSSYPIKWDLSKNEGPDWETAWDLVDLEPINKSEKASDEFFNRYSNYSGTKIGGFPSEIQNSLSTEGDFIFQIGSEDKSNWMWSDNGTGYFLKNKNGDWVFDCQVY